MDGIDSSVLANIERVLGCKAGELEQITSLDKGHTNESTLFSCRGVRYIYRVPGAATAAIIDREQEYYAQTTADELGIDGTTVYFDRAEGWKLARFIDNTREFNYHNTDDVEAGISLIRTLHEAALPCAWHFDPLRNAGKLERLTVMKAGPSSVKRFGLDHVRADVEYIDRLVAADGVEKMLCHNDACDMNFLVSNEEMRLIDWEYAALADPASDLAAFICGGEHTYDEVLSILACYLQRDPTSDEIRHLVGFIVLFNYHWLMWGIYQEEHGKGGNRMLRIWENYLAAFVPRALELYAR